MTSSPVRQIFDPSLECELHTDASKIGIGAILIQNNYPIRYFSKKLSDTQTRYTATELECIAGVNAINYFRIYLEGRNFIIFTDHLALKWLFRFSESKSRLFRWSKELSCYDYEVVHRPGKQMAHVDVCLVLQSTCYSKLNLYVPDNQNVRKNWKNSNQIRSCQMVWLRSKSEGGGGRL